MIIWGNPCSEWGENSRFPPLHRLWRKKRFPVVSSGGVFPQVVGSVVAALPQPLYGLAVTDQHEKTPF